MNLDQAAQFLDENHVKLVLAQFVDIHGVAKTKAVPVSHFAGYSGRRRRLRRLRRVGIGPGAARSRLHGRRRSGDAHARFPGSPAMRGSSATAACGSKPWPFDTRYILQQQIARLAERGWLLNTGLGAGVHARRPQRDGSFGPADDSDRLDKPCYDYKGLSRSRAFLETLVDALMAGRHRRLPDRPRRRQRPVRDQLHVQRRPDVGRSDDLLPHGGRRDRPLAGRDLHVHAQAVFQSHRQRHAHAHLAGRPAQPLAQLCSTTPPTRVLWVCRRWPIISSAVCWHHAPALDRAGRSFGQFLQAAGGRPIAIGGHLGAGFHLLRRQQSHVNGPQFPTAAWNCG